MEDGSPAGGQWSFDHQNRKKMPKRMLGSILGAFPALGQVERDARAMFLKYPDNPGSIDEPFIRTCRWLRAILEFLIERFALFSDTKTQLSKARFFMAQCTHPDAECRFADSTANCQCCLEVFEREHDTAECSGAFFDGSLVGGVYASNLPDLGVQMRTTNHWQHHRKIPQSFYTATTGIDPIDDVIRRVLDTGTVITLSGL